MVWGIAEGRTCLPILAVQIEALWLAWEQMLTVPLRSTVCSCTSATHVPVCPSIPTHTTHVLHTLASPLHLGCSPGPESHHTQSPLIPTPRCQGI